MRASPAARAAAAHAATAADAAAAAPAAVPAAAAEPAAAAGAAAAEAAAHAAAARAATAHAAAAHAAAACAIAAALVGDAVLGRVRELELDGPAVHRALLRIADIADLAVVIVIPGQVVLADVRVRHRLDQLVRRHGGRVLFDRPGAAAAVACAAEVRHD